MTRTMDPARRERERLLQLEHQTKARREAHAVAAGVEETVALSLARGAGIEAPTRVRGERERPYRRQAGLDWLVLKGRITAAQKAAGEQYGGCYRRAAAGQSIPSSLDVKPGMSAPGGRPIGQVLSHAASTAQAAARLAALRARLCGQPDLIAACDKICGQELTPREAAANDREAGRLEAVLSVALDILAAGRP